MAHVLPLMCVVVTLVGAEAVVLFLSVRVRMIALETETAYHQTFAVATMAILETTVLFLTAALN